MKKLLLIVLLPATLLLQACNDRQVAAGVGFAGGAILGAAIASNANRHSYYNDYYYDRGYYGGGYYGRGYYGRGYYGGGYWSLNSVQGDEATVQLAAKSTLPKVSHADRLAAKYRLSKASAQKIVLAFNQGSNEDFSGFQKIGLNTEDLASFSTYELPSDATIATMAQQLRLSPEATKAMLLDMMAQVKARADRDQVQAAAL